MISNYELVIVLNKHSSRFGNVGIVEKVINSMIYVRFFPNQLDVFLKEDLEIVLDGKFDIRVQDLRAHLQKEQYTI